MKKCFLHITILFSTISSYAQNHDIIDSDNYADSAAYYLQKALLQNGLDSNMYFKGCEFIRQMDADTVSQHKIEKIINSYKLKKQFEASDGIELEIIYRFTKSEEYSLAIAYCKQIIDKYDADRNSADRNVFLNALLEIRVPLRNSSLPEAFDYYTSQLKGYLEKNDSSAISISYFCIGTTYRLAGLPDMSIYNIKKSNSYINKNDTTTKAPISGLGGWTNNTSVLGQLYLEVSDYESAIQYSNEARDVRLNIFKYPNVSYLNCNIAYAKLMLNELDSVNDLLNNSILLASQYTDYPSLVRAYEIKGQYFLVLNMLDSAESNLVKCKEVMLLHNVNHFSAAGYHTPDYYLAKVRISQKRFKDARTLLEQEISKIGSMKKELLKEQKLLIEVLHKLGDSEAADSTFKEYSELQASINAEERKYRSKSFEVEAKIEESENTINNLVTEKRISDLTKKFFIGVAFLLLIVASVIFNRFRVTRKQKVIIEKEKHRSEELLLNILPSEVAEELKQKGSADAKQFDRVTVMFTDFKNFTQISEKLTPAELVAEIDYCFKAFDGIIAKHNIEKIKTIGDAYMCAGGLPIANKTNAGDVVSAALEIQEFMRKHLQQRESKGKEIFEIRIGIHTGPVVAGIVGIKKFAYDIWGDTVNIAARMESSGEQGKINISGSTYELVKLAFNCIHRGKIQAKNKGEIDMYFVEGILQ